VGVTDLKEE
jgi:hypothetical protein